MLHILVVDDEPKISRLITARLEDAGYSVESCGNVTEARTVVQNGIFDLVISDVRLPDGTGIDMLRYARTVHANIQVILITAYGTINQAVDAMRLGAFDYVQKPFEMDALILLVERALETIRMREALDVATSERKRARQYSRLSGNSVAIGRVKSLIERIAPLPTSVLITGASGTGKELVAETIHAMASTRERPMVRVNCLAIPASMMENELFGHVRGAFTGAESSRKGLFELATGGTLFLDEIGDLPMDMQGKLLRVLEEGVVVPLGATKPVKVDTRVIAATNADLSARVKEGRFREDLYFRLNIFPIRLPSLTERREDIPFLVKDLLAGISERLGLSVSAVSNETMELLMAYRWPGNVRELRNILERALILAGGGEINGDHLPCELAQGCRLVKVIDEGDFGERVDAYRRDLIVSALKNSGGVKKTAAETLGLSPRALSHYLRRLDIEDEQRDYET